LAFTENRFSPSAPENNTGAETTEPADARTLDCSSPKFWRLFLATCSASEPTMIRKLTSGKYRLYSRKKNPKTGRRRNLGTFGSRAAAAKQEKAVQYFKRH
jgi:hypothetical protein